MKGFETSKDYEKLWLFIQNGLRIPGWIKARDSRISIVEIKLNSLGHYMIGTRGFGYEGFERDKNCFLDSCNTFDLEYITPNKQ